MTEPIRCFLLEPTGRTMRWLRRYTPSQAGVRTCEPFGYHNARTFLDVVDGEAVGGDVRWPRDDPRWPAACACGYVFGPDDAWNMFIQHEMRRSDDGSLTNIHDAPVGAMWWATWLAGHHESPKHQRRGGGPHLILKTPGGEWDIDAPSSNANGEGWDRDGQAPDIVARPSIQMDHYHGFLGGSAGERRGYLVTC